MTLHPSLFAAAIVLVTAAGVYGDTQDWELTLRPSGEKVCATGQQVCEMAARALHTQPKPRWSPLGEEGHAIDGTCAPKPNCRDVQSLCIKNYNC